jgi:probable F420-dependent oxidoreductase
LLRFGVHLTNSGGGAVSPDSLVNPGDIIEIARCAEKLGYDSLWANEHLTRPMPDTPPETKFIEPLILLATLSGYTSRIRLGSAVVILPVRDPFICAKQITALDLLTKSRFSFGVGVGRFEREYLTHGKCWEERGKILDEQLLILCELITGKSLTFEGKYYSCKGFSVSPIPDEGSKIPIILGGTARVAVSRAAKFCDGMMPGHLSPEQIAEIRRILEDELSKNQRRISDFTIFSQNIVSIASSDDKAESKFLNHTYVKKITYAKEIRKNSLVGSASSIKELISKYEKAGLQEFVLIFAEENLRDFIEAMTNFYEEVIGAFR